MSNYLSGLNTFEAFEAHRSHVQVPYIGGLLVVRTFETLKTSNSSETTYCSCFTGGSNRFKTFEAHRILVKQTNSAGLLVVRTHS